MVTGPAEKFWRWILVVVMVVFVFVYFINSWTCVFIGRKKVKKEKVYGRFIKSGILL